MNDLDRWLQELGLGHYAAVFVENDVDAEVLLELTEGDLEKLGLSLGHRKKLLKAETCFSHALDVARDQGTRLWELRTAGSLARLWREQGRRGEARDLLAPVYGWFTEGLDTPDLKDAKALLDALR